MPNKYTYYAVIQQDYGHGFEDVDHHETNSAGKAKNYEALKDNTAAYLANSPYPTRVVSRRERNESA